MQEAAIVLPVLADKDRLHRRFHIVVHTTGAGAPEERERPLMGVEHHLLRLARISAHQHHAAMAETDMRDLHGRRHPDQHDDLVAPVELVGFTRRESQWDESARRRARVRLRPDRGVAADSVIAALVAERPQLLEKADQGQPLARRPSSFAARSRSSSAFQLPSFGRGCTLALIWKTTWLPTGGLSAPCCGTALGRARSP